MQRRPLIVGALVALVGVVVVLCVQRDADDVSGSPAPTSAATTTTPSPSATPSGTPSTAPELGPTPGPTAEPPEASAPDTTGHVLEIPGIGLTTELHAEGLRDGRINPPAGTTMWFTGYDRVAPGETGTAVIAGHVIARGQPDVFVDLHQVEVGDEVEVRLEDGGTETFEVVRAGVVDKDELTTDQTVWGHNSSVARLAIVTCDDAFGFRDDGHRVANYVVIAEPA